ncbi:N-acetyl-anhydromuramyl-L-alanine amidase AmpD [Pseudomonas nitritireducens]|uniref:N-acetylmuramoyl-L-alanine amidase n=1 Tax=Pseudomonas nitroreducens TaxID=46680 RepID=A0A7W7P5M9_PSENT|nr:peptidoglycan recognition family protein [Pseudomonas nitritireducens]MBB4867457.1 N-acetyl-anhydromuramyl-L-alanine amidase AmpD [Pseudomonas nitritireducens]
MDWEHETDKWPFVKAKHFNAIKDVRDVRLIVIHSMEAPEKGDTAEAVAKYFATTATEASAHLCVDNNSIIQCVLDNDVAWAAPGANHDGVHIELAGYAKQEEKEWLDAYSVLVLENAAEATAQYCLKYLIPIRHLTDAQLNVKSNRGIVSHAQVSKVFKKSTHTDPGSGFPWDHFMSRVLEKFNQRKKLLGLN